MDDHPSPSSDPVLLLLLPSTTPAAPSAPPVLDRFCRPDNGTSLRPSDPALTNLKWTFRCIMITISIIGVAGNVLNLVTLRSPSLRNVPFMFIRALALFDLISLAAILVHFMLDTVHINADPVVFYEVWVQDVLINSFLVAGLYCAVLLTIERYLLIRKPFTTGGRLLSIESTVLIKIGCALLVSVLLHSPMALQNKAKCTEMDAETGKCVGRWVKGNNVELLCHQPMWTLFNYYKMGRECLRFFCVLLLIVLNAKVARSLQMTKRNRRLLIKRLSMPPPDIQVGQQRINSLASPPIGGNNKREVNSLMRSFTEKKLTALMIAICVIFAAGNIPQMVVMVFQNESVEHTYNFQVFRHLANTAEVLNHFIAISGLNFFIFCMASSEYCRAFLSLSPVRWLLRHFPLCASLARARLNGHLEATALVVGCASVLTNTNQINESGGSVKSKSIVANGYGATMAGVGHNLVNGVGRHWQGGSGSLRMPMEQRRREVGRQRNSLKTTNNNIGADSLTKPIDIGTTSMTTLMGAVAAGDDFL